MKHTFEHLGGEIVDFSVWASAAKIDRCDRRNLDAVMRLHWDNWQIMLSAPGSTHNHQAWAGGYLEHIRQVNYYAACIYDMLRVSGGFEGLPEEELFDLEDLLTVTTLHDIEKPFRTQVKDGRIIVDGRLRTKADREAFKQNLLEISGIVLTAQQQNAMKYVEGVRDADYSPRDRVMLPMAAIAHAADLLSARGTYATAAFSRLDLQTT